MSNQEFDNYVALIGKLLQLAREQREQIAGELQDHLQMRVSDLMIDGVAKQDAVAIALEEFGDAAVMAKNFQSVINLKRRRWMMRFATISIAGAFLAAVLTMALWPDNARFGTPGFSLAQETEAAESGAADINSIRLRLSDATQRDRKTEEALKQVVDLDFIETPFSDVMVELRTMTGVNFLLNSSAKDDSLTEDEPLTFSIHQLSLNKSLELMLVEKNATYVIDEGVVVFISRDDADDASYMRLKMFDCRELVKVLPESYPTYLGDSMNNAVGGGGGGFFCVPQVPTVKESANEPKPMQGQGLDGGPMAQAPANPRPRAVATREATLLNLVFSMVDPDSWEHAGLMASAQVVNGILVVRQKETAFRKIENLLLDLNANVLPVGKAGQVSLLRRPRTDRIQPDPAYSAKKDPFAGSRKNPIGESPGDPFSSGTSGKANDPYRN